LHFEHVSWERIVSGSGISNIYEFLSKTEQYAEPSNITTSIIKSIDRPAAITQAAESGDSTRCNEVLNKFLYNYGAAAGNLTLSALATGGLFIGGGIAPKLANRMINDEFMRGFSNKGRFSELMANVPVKLILESKTALFGAALYSIRAN
jgi:glucokinase